MGDEWRHSQKLGKELGASHMDISDGVALNYTLSLQKRIRKDTPAKETQGQKER